MSFKKIADTSHKQDIKIVSIGTLWLRWQFISNITWLSDLVLIYNSNFILCTDRARICFKCYIEKERKCSFENALVEKSKSSTWINGLVEGCIQ